MLNVYTYLQLAPKSGIDVNKIEESVGILQDDLVVNNDKVSPARIAQKKENSNISADTIITLVFLVILLLIVIMNGVSSESLNTMIGMINLLGIAYVLHKLNKMERKFK